MTDRGFELPAHWHFRPDTWDALIFHEVVDRNQYRLPPRLETDAAVVDVGAHCGAFTWACLLRGAGRVFAYEIEAENFALLRHNLDPYRDAVVARQAAVWRSDIEEPLFYRPPADAVNTGGGFVSPGGGEPIGATMRFDDVVAEAAGASAHGRVRLVKLDAEGSEFPILYTSRTLDCVDTIVGEYHDHRWHDGQHPGDLPPFAVERLSDHLRSWGFVVAWRERAPGIGMFRATRPARNGAGIRSARRR